MAYRNLGYVSENSRYLQKALEWSDRVSDRERYHIEGAFYWENETTLDKAIQAYKNLLKLYPEDGSGNLNLGCVYRDLEEWDKAIEYIEKAWRDDPRSLYAPGNLARIFCAKGQYDRANAALDECLRNNPDNEAAYNYRARYALIQKRFPTAQAEAERGYFLNPALLDIISIRGDIYHCLDDINSAETHTIMTNLATFRVHIAPLGFEIDRITIPLHQTKADKLWLLAHDNRTKDLSGPYLEKIKKECKRLGVQVEVSCSNRLNLFSTIKSIKDIIEKEKNNYIYVNVASGSKIQAIACMMACMVLNVKI